MTILEYLVKMDNITKTFPGVKALDDVSFTLKRHEVVALLGENGAGKSTLVKVLSGVHNCESGDIYIDGERVENLSPKKAQELGITIIHQELNMCPHLTVAENIFLGRELSRYSFMNNRLMHKRAREILDQLDIDIDTEALVGDLPMSKQQMVEIARALSVNSKILIMDEPTSSLSSKEIDELFAIIRTLKAKGCGIIYISHRLDELVHIVDRVVIMRDGKYITSFDFDQSRLPEIITNMVGREIKEKYPRITCDKGECIMEVKNLNAGKLVRNISLELYEGEILGIAGLIGAGRSETARAIFGVDPHQSGEIILDGKTITVNRPIDAIKNGIVLVPEDRKKDGLCTKLSIRENISLPNLDIMSMVGGIINRNREETIVEKTIKDFNIRTASTETDAENLSGGNQQKVVVARWLVMNSRVVIFDDPTRGIDVGAKVEIYNLMNELKAKGVGVMFISSEMQEIMGISDRILVMCDGRITGEMDIKEATQKKILEYATQFDNKKEVLS